MRTRLRPRHGPAESGVPRSRAEEAEVMDQMFDQGSRYRNIDQRLGRPCSLFLGISVKESG